MHMGPKGGTMHGLMVAVAAFVGLILHAAQTCLVLLFLSCRQLGHAACSLRACRCRKLHHVRMWRASLLSCRWTECNPDILQNFLGEQLVNVILDQRYACAVAQSQLSANRMLAVKSVICAPTTARSHPECTADSSCNIMDYSTVAMLWLQAAA